jgi:hypothetical protein
MYLYNIKEKLNAWRLDPLNKKCLDTFNNIIVDKSPNINTIPYSLYVKDNKYYLTTNIRDCVTLLYEISFANLFKLIDHNKTVGYYDKYVKYSIIKM